MSAYRVPFNGCVFYVYAIGFSSLVDIAKLATRLIFAFTDRPGELC
jgi:hypothetical protein